MGMPRARVPITLCWTPRDARKVQRPHAMFVVLLHNNMRVSAKAPCRVDLAGATLDIWPLYLFHDNVVTLNFAIDRYTSCDIVTRDDSAIVLRSRDLAREETFASFDELHAAKRYRLPLLALL